MCAHVTMCGLQVPTASVVVDGNVALNKLRWHQTGHHIGVADDMGRIYIYDVGEVRFCASDVVCLDSISVCTCWFLCGPRPTREEEEKIFQI